MVTARKVIPIKKVITAWSYSRINDYAKCPELANFKFIQKIKEPGSKAMDRGSDIHSLAQKFSRGSARDRTPAELECFEEEFRTVQKIKTALTEQQWAFTKDWKPTGWFDDDAWCRVVVDLAFGSKSVKGRFYVVDYKTGKLNPNHLGQLSLYALAALLMFPEMAEVVVELWYLDHGIIWPEKEKAYTHADLPKLKAYWENESKPIMTDRQFKPKPSSNCSWCFFSKSKNGNCKY